jgi:hypothetical protein
MTYNRVPSAIDVIYLLLNVIALSRTVFLFDTSKQGVIHPE